jgi:hypothetical protein
MKITIGTNTFGNIHRQNIAVESWYALRDKFDIDLYDFQFVDEQKSFSKNYNLDTIFSLKRSSADLFNNGKKLPYVNDIISDLSDNCKGEYFIFTNSDVIIMPSLINLIKESEPDCISCSRLDITNVSSFENLKSEANPVRWEIAGFDTFVFKKQWYLRHKQLFQDYFLGRPAWDVVYTGLMKVYGKDFYIGNYNPPLCMHMHHGLASTINETVEKDFNINNCNLRTIDNFMGKMMGCYIHRYLIRRQPYGAFLHPIANEQEIEKDYFRHFKSDYK